MQTVNQCFQAEYRIKGSKFLSFLIPCHTTQQAEKQLSEIRDLHPTATHHCYAFRVDPAVVHEHGQDDGEPGGSAGLPILNRMRSADIVNAVIFVVRYYGGTKLGKSGLIDAYGKAAKYVINQSNLKTLVPTRRFIITYSYDQQALIDKLKHTFTLFEIDSTYTENVRLVIECPEKELLAFENRVRSLRHLLLEVDKGDVSCHILSSFTE